MAESGGSGLETVGERLLRLRRERGLSQRDLSAPGITYAYISRIEAGARKPSVKALRMLARKLGVTAEYLETGTDLAGSEQRELRLVELELRLRLDGEVLRDELDELLADATADGDVKAAARARIALGIAAAGRGDHDETVVQLEEALATEIVSPLSRTEVYAMLGRAYAARGTPRLAVDLFERALAELERLAPGDEGMRIRLTSYLSCALTDAGELERARAVVRESLSGTGRAVDPYTRVRLHRALGRLSIEQAKPVAALDSFRRAVALLEVTEDTLHLARAHLDCTQALIDADELEQADAHLGQALHLLGPYPADDDLAVVRRLQATLAARRGEHREAERHGNEALLLARELPSEQGQTWAALADARAAAGDPTAEEAYRKALELLGEHGTVREEAGLLRSYGRYLRSTHRDADALDVFERAADVASDLQPRRTVVEH